MALAIQALSRVGQTVVGVAVGTPKAAMVAMWLYGTDDAAATVEAAGYFNGARGNLAVGDMIDASMVNGGTPVSKRYVVTAVPASGNVTVALQATTAG
jgi:hypothetical protein